MSEAQGERLQKALAGLGLGSRRAIEEWIRDGRIAVNGRTAELGVRVLPTDRITLDGKPISLAGIATEIETAVLGYHKPLGEVTTRSDPQGRPTVFDRLPPAPSGRWIVVGRLDVNTSGLLLFTNDGELAHRLMHPSSEVEREYLARLDRAPSPVELRYLRDGVQLEDGWARFDRLEASAAHERHPQDDKPWYRGILHEGRNREVRRLFAAVGCEVERLQRLRYGPISLPQDLRPGQARLLPPALVAQLKTAAGL